MNLSPANLKLSVDHQLQQLFQTVFHPVLNQVAYSRRGGMLGYSRPLKSCTIQAGFLQRVPNRQLHALVNYLTARREVVLHRKTQTLSEAKLDYPAILLDKSGHRPYRIGRATPWPQSCCTQAIWGPTHTQQVAIWSTIEKHARGEPQWRLHFQLCCSYHVLHKSKVSAWLVYVLRFVWRHGLNHCKDSPIKTVASSFFPFPLYNTRS